MDCSLPPLCPWNFPGKNTRAGCHFLSQGNFPPGMKPASPVLVGRFFTTALPGKPLKGLQNTEYYSEYIMTVHTLYVYIMTICMLYMLHITYMYSICIYNNTCIYVFSVCIIIYTYVLHGRRQWHPTPVLLPGKYHGRRSLVGCSPWGR